MIYLHTGWTRWVGTVHSGTRRHTCNTGTMHMMCCQLFVPSTAGFKRSHNGAKTTLKRRKDSPPAQHGWNTFHVDPHRTEFLPILPRSNVQSGSKLSSVPQNSTRRPQKKYPKHIHPAQILDLSNRTRRRQTARVPTDAGCPTGGVAGLALAGAVEEEARRAARACVAVKAREAISPARWKDKGTENVTLVFSNRSLMCGIRERRAPAHYAPRDYCWAQLRKKPKGQLAHVLPSKHVRQLVRHAREGEI